MKFNLDLQQKYEEISVTIHAKEWSEELEEVVRKLEYQLPKRILGIDGDRTILLSPGDIEYVFAEKRKVFASVKKQSIEITMKLYEAEGMLRSYGFCRLSKSAIGNLSKITHFELAFNGNLCVYFRSGEKEYVSRKYVQELKRKLILGDENDGS